MKPCRMQFDERYWYQSGLNWLTALLLPVSWLFGCLAAIRRFCYRYHLLASYHSPVPVIVVGNITVGGTGKTPCVIEIAHYLKSKGLTPGIVSRGAGGVKQCHPLIVSATTSTLDAGDEAVLMARESQCPVVVCANRIDAVKCLLQHETGCDVVISDDGLQHYRLARDVEIAVVDGERLFGNGCLLPSGPLRESPARLQSVDFVIVNGGVMRGSYEMVLSPTAWVAVAGHHRLPAGDMTFERAHAVAGIGHPARFFKQLRSTGLVIIEHSFPDHYRFQASDFNFGDDLPIVMTAKDAVKCEAFADQRMWYLAVAASLQPEFLNKLYEKLQGVVRSCMEKEVPPV